jgi:ankyrin repeat protein
MAAYIPYLDLLCGTDSELLFLAAKSNNQLLLDTLITMACSTTCFNLNQRDGQGLPLIHLLVLKRNRPALNHLLRCSSVNLNSQDAEGLTALHHAVILGAAAIVKQLLASGAVVNIRDKNGETPLFEAVRKADLDLCKCLLERGTWNGLNREEHKKLRQWAKASGSREVMLLLKKYQNGA